jgi:hypothetical protein
MGDALVSVLSSHLFKWGQVNHYLGSYPVLHECAEYRTLHASLWDNL